ncbi:hypothetical protein BCIN_05g06900 [Botrytis cinerea B05.10]|uniref:Uncharacterized protein n=1 Tax=Botryotinia fuckeliana (strain B05.10) TaxID=332648 RepID=A0A384JIQ1_BOTFB|nr:hypothetical protein BCIN_05g06900 [Botrytis cinerea B05.10]ATZ50331.1 hypothetical protein BCIN_05g06900 [Botrytis cinerea B05.10]
MPEIFRSQNKQLQHLELHPQSARNRERERSVPSQGAGSISPLTQLPSPSLVAARAYASQYQKPIGWKFDACSRHNGSIQAQQTPRRHSTMATLAKCTPSLDKASSSVISPSSQMVPGIRLTNEKIGEPDTCPIIRTKNSLNFSMFDVRRHSETPASSTPTPCVPFQYTHDRLQIWGHVYFGNVVSADAFVNAVSLRRPSFGITKEKDVHEPIKVSDQVTIRARVLPREIERQPFWIQREIDIRQLRDSIPIPQSNQDHPRDSTIVRRSSRLRRLSLQQVSIPDRRGTHRIRRQINSNHVVVPIHIEYALHYLPVLAALMLSGHIRNGDFIDLPLPSPEAWVDTIAYVYTGQGEITPAMKENISFLAGRVESEG